MVKDHNIVCGVPRRRHARRDRQGDPPEHLFGARVIKICVDCGHAATADEIRLVIREAAKAG
jgi:hypothetical protein